MVTLTCHACKYKVHKRHLRYILIFKIKMTKEQKILAGVKETIDWVLSILDPCRVQATVKLSRLNVELSLNPCRDQTTVKLSRLSVELSLNPCRDQVTVKLSRLSVELRLNPCRDQATSIMLNRCRDQATAIVLDPRRNRATANLTKTSQVKTSRC